MNCMTERLMSCGILHRLQSLLHSHKTAPARLAQCWRFWNLFVGRSLCKRAAQPRLLTHFCVLRRPSPSRSTIVQCSKASDRMERGQELQGSLTKAIYDKHCGTECNRLLSRAFLNMVALMYRCIVSWNATQIGAWDVSDDHLSPYSRIIRPILQDSGSKISRHHTMHSFNLANAGAIMLRPFHPATCHLRVRDGRLEVSATRGLQHRPVKGKGLINMSTMRTRKAMR